MAKTSIKNGSEASTQGTADTSQNTEASTSNVATKRQAKASVTYVMPDGSEKNFPDESSKVIRIETTGGTKRDFDVSTLAPNVLACAVLQGVVTRFQRGYQALKQEDEVLASIDETIADLNNGIWIEVGTGEPRVTNLVSAIVMALEASGETVDAERRKGIIEKLSADENLRKEMRERPVIKANLTKLAAEAAQKRAEEAAKAAEGASFSF